MKKTYKQNPIMGSTLESVELTEGITMETQVALFMNNQTDLERATPLIYTERKEGIVSAYNIKSDRFDIAIDAMEKSAKSLTAKRQDRHVEMKIVEDGKPDSVQGTSE